MKRNLRKRLSAVFVTTAILFSTIFALSVSVSVQAATVSFSPRLTAPDYSNKYYYNGNYNIFYACGYGMPNCTAYAYGRAYEILGTQPDLSTGSAYMWYDYNRSYGSYNYGQTPKVGAIACWSYSGGGHVAVVEKIDSYGNITLSNSAWNSTNFYLTYASIYDSNPGGNSWWNFQGYIYLVDSVVTPEPTTTVAPTTTVPKTTVAPTTTTPAAPTPSSYKNGVYKVDAQPYLNMRSGSGLSYSQIATVADGAQIVVTNTAYADGIDWGYTNYNGKKGWVALSFCEYVAERIQPTTAQPTTVQPTTEAPTEAPTTVPKTIHGGKGDVDGDGAITIQDATLIQQYLAGMLTLSKSQMKWADFNASGTVSIDDATMLQRYLLNN